MSGAKVLASCFPWASVGQYLTRFTRLHFGFADVGAAGPPHAGHPPAAGSPLGIPYCQRQAFTIAGRAQGLCPPHVPLPLGEPPPGPRPRLHTFGCHRQVERLKYGWD